MQQWMQLLRFSATSVTQLVTQFRSEESLPISFQSLPINTAVFMHSSLIGICPKAVEIVNTKRNRLSPKTVEQTLPKYKSFLNKT